MSLALLAGVLSGAAFGAAGLLTSLGVAAAWRHAGLRGRLRASADSLFVLRLLPGAAGLTLALGLALPAFLRHEPAGMEERPGAALAGLALLLCAPLLAGARRGLLTALASRRLRRRVLAGARPVRLHESLAPAVETRLQAPAVAVVGLLRPRLVLSRRVRRRLTREQLRAVVCHENGHVLRADNLRHWLLASAPDWLGRLGPARELERAWREAAEREADAGALRQGPREALALASALLAVARIQPAGAQPASTLHSGSAEALRERVSCLAAAAAPAPGRLRGLVLAVAAGWLCAPLLAHVRPGALAAAHAALETLVRTLP